MLLIKKHTKWSSLVSGWEATRMCVFHNCEDKMEFLHSEMEINCCDEKLNLSERREGLNAMQLIVEIFPLIFPIFFISFPPNSYIDFLCNMLENTESYSEDKSISSASSSPVQCQQFQNGSTNSPIVPNEKLSYMFNVWRMDSEWQNSTKVEWSFCEVPRKRVIKENLRDNSSLCSSCLHAYSS